MFQTNGEMFVSELINDRFQILQSKINKEYFIYDATKGDNLRERGESNTLYFKNLDNAMNHLNVKEVKKLQYIQPKKEIVVAPKPAAVVMAPAASPTVTEAPMVAKAPMAVKTSGRKPSAFSMLIELLKTTKNDDDTIIVLVKGAFPDSNYNASMVKFHRKRLVTEGVI